MKTLAFIFLWAVPAFPAGLTILPPGVGSSQTIVVIIQCADSVSTPCRPSAFRLVAPGGEEISPTDIVTIGNRIRFVFTLTADNFVVFERLTDDSTGYYLLNDEPITAGNSVIESGELKKETKNRIPCIDKRAWETYILGTFASAFLFRHEFSIGTRLNSSDSTATVYYLELAQSDHYYQSGNVSVFWGVKGRWSTGEDDRLNYADLYPLVFAINNPLWKVSFAAGAECGYRGFTQQGEATVRGKLLFRLPYNPVDLTLGARRWRLNPVLTLSTSGNLGWSDILLPDSLKHSYIVDAAVRYDIPVGTRYYLRSNGLAEYSTVTRQLQYRYALSFGYIADGTIRVLIEYRQGYQAVSYQFDKQLLLGIAIDGFNDGKNNDSK